MVSLARLAPFMAWFSWDVSSDLLLRHLFFAATEAWLRMLFSPIGKLVRQCHGLRPCTSLTQHCSLPSGTIESVHFTPANENAPGQASILFATTEQAHSSLGLDGYVALGLPM